MSETSSKFGMLRNLQQAAEERAGAEKQQEAVAVKSQSRKAGKQESAKTGKQMSRPKEDQTAPAAPQTVELKHYSSYMPLPLFAQLQIYVAKQKAARGNTGDKVSIQSVIAEAVQEYLDRNDE